MTDTSLGVVRERRELLDGVTYERRDGAVTLHMDTPWQALSSAVLGGGRRYVHSLLHLHVDKGYRCSRPERHLREVARSLRLPGPTVGLMTAVQLGETQLLAGSAEGASVRALITVGLGNAARPGWRAVSRVGTINVIVLCDRKLSEHAVVELVMLVAEAKAAAIVEADTRTADGLRASGTSTDAVAVLWRRSGREEYRHAGSATELGTAIGRMVDGAIRRAMHGEPAVGASR